MKRKIFEKLLTLKKKCVLCLMLASFTAINTGFTEQEEVPVAEEIQETQINETSATEPTTIAVGENGRIQISADDDEITRAYAEIVENSLGKDLTEVHTLEEFSALEEVATLEEPQDVVETESGALPYAEVMSMEATAYLPTDGSAEGLTAMGIPATYGIVAVDPDIIPLGSRVYIPGYGEALAADTGGAIYGYRIDLCMENYYEAMDFGRRTITVFVLK